jgi:hypothetical protein
MNGKLLMLKCALGVGLLLGCAGVARAQYVVLPTTTYYAPAVAAPVYAPATTTYYAPAVVAPTTTYYAPAVAAPVTTYYAPAPAAPITAYSAPAQVTYYAPAAPVVVARPIRIGRNIYGGPTAYVPGQPVRNTLRYISP